MQNVVITKDMDESSKSLMAALQTNQVLASALLTISGSPAGTKGPVAAGATLDLTNVSVTSVQQSSAGNPVETIALSFESSEMTSQPAADKTATDAPGVVAVVGEKQGPWSSPVLEWNWGMATPVTASGMTGESVGPQATGKAQMKEFSFVMPSGPSTVQFITALSNNEQLQSLTLAPKSGPSYGLSQGRVTDLQYAAGPDGDTTTIKIAYRTITEAAGDKEESVQWGDDR
jgi:type VI protein secretion system component Hcp